jgi:hypothetical protein
MAFKVWNPLEFSVARTVVVSLAFAGSGADPIEKNLTLTMTSHPSNMDLR